MRALLALGLVFAGACSAVDDFGAFRFDAGAGVDSGGAPFGAACSAATACMQYSARPIQCIPMISTVTFKDGLCTRGCIPGAAACPDLPGGVCMPVNGTDLCLVECTGGGAPCRSGYDCCTNNSKVNSGEIGACAPSDSSLCK